jgi:hypothetical protein
MHWPKMRWLSMNKLVFSLLEKKGKLKTHPSLQHRLHRELAGKSFCSPKERCFPLYRYKL